MAEELAKESLKLSLNPLTPAQESSEITPPQVTSQIIYGSSHSDLLNQTEKALYQEHLRTDLPTQFVVVTPGESPTTSIDEQLPKDLIPLQSRFQKTKAVTIRLKKSISEKISNYRKHHPWQIALANVRFVGIGGALTQIIYIQYQLGWEVALLGGLTGGLASWGLMIFFDWEARFLNKKGWLKLSPENASLSETATKWFALEYIYSNLVATMVLGSGYLLHPTAATFEHFNFLMLQYNIALASAQGMIAQGALERLVTYLRVHKQDHYLKEAGLPAYWTIEKIHEHFEKTFKEKANSPEFFKVQKLKKQSEKLRLLTSIASTLTSITLTSLTVGAAVGVESFQYALVATGTAGVIGNFILHRKDLRRFFTIRDGAPRSCRVLFR